MNSYNPTDASGAAIVQVATPAVASTLVAKATPGNLYGCCAVAGASAGFLMLFDATAAPANGTVTPIKVWPVAANAGLELDFPKPIRGSKGLVLMFSTTGPFSLTGSATAFISASAR